MVSANGFSVELDGELQEMTLRWEIFSQRNVMDNRLPFSVEFYI
jgi:hypothetical protein